jgi:hypothetical protein
VVIKDSAEVTIPAIAKDFPFLLVANTIMPSINEAMPKGTDNRKHKHTTSEMIPNTIEVVAMALLPFCDCSSMS